MYNLSERAGLAVPVPVERVCYDAEGRRETQISDWIAVSRIELSYSNEVSLSDRLGTRVSFKQNETRIPNSDPGRPRLVSISQEARDDCSLIDH